MERVKKDPLFKGAVARAFVKVLYSNKIAPKADRVNICKDTFFKIPAVFHTKKNFYLIEEFNENIKKMQTAGLIDYWISQYIDDGTLKEEKEFNDPKVLTFYNLLGCFQILIIGHIASLIVFFFELVLKGCKKGART